MSGYYEESFYEYCASHFMDMYIISLWQISRTGITGLIGTCMLMYAELFYRKKCMILHSHEKCFDGASCSPFLIIYNIVDLLVLVVLGNM